jgi:hypothetical protein
MFSVKGLAAYIERLFWSNGSSIVRQSLLGRVPDRTIDRFMLVGYKLEGVYSLALTACTEFPINEHALAIE